jgi:DNA-binding response OmpR family regulator
MIKPVRRGELLIRVQVLLRRAYPAQNTSEQIQFGQYVFELPIGRLSLNGKQIDVTQKEFDLALLFFRNLGRPLSRAYILEAIWSREVDVPSRTMDTHVSRVRNKLHLKPENGFRLTPVYSYGYRLEELSK